MEKTSTGKPRKKQKFRLTDVGITIDPLPRDVIVGMPINPEWNHLPIEEQIALTLKEKESDIEAALNEANFLLLLSESRNVYKIADHIKNNPPSALALACLTVVASARRRKLGGDTTAKKLKEDKKEHNDKIIKQAKKLLQHNPKWRGLAGRLIDTPGNSRADGLSAKQLNRILNAARDEGKL